MKEKWNTCMIMNNKAEVKTYLMALGMAAVLFAYGYAANRLGHDHSQHEHQASHHDHVHEHAH